MLLNAMNYLVASIFTFAALVEARKAQRSLQARHYFNGIASTIGAAACLTIAQEAWRKEWI